MPLVAAVVVVLLVVAATLIALRLVRPRPAPGIPAEEAVFAQVTLSLREDQDVPRGTPSGRDAA